MKIVFISNYLSHHQKPFCEEMVKLTKNNFTFIATVPMDKERINMGWKIEESDYVLYAHLDYNSEKEAQRLINNADVAIIGSAEDKYIIPRLHEKKLTFRYSERFYKEGLSWRNILRAFVGSWLHHGRFQKLPLYMLCASAYTAADAAVFNNYLGRTYKWGYFPVVKEHDLNQLMRNKKFYEDVSGSNGKVTILWVGRFIDCKHPEVPIYLAEILRDKDYLFNLKMIGSGEMEAKIEKLIEEKRLSDHIEMLGVMTPDQVRKHMEKADIYLFTSDFNEGWGAVLNESMNSGCAIVASHAIGSVPFLIEDGINGLIYENGNLDHLLQQVERLMKDEVFRLKLGTEAYYTILEKWNAKVAAKRLIELSSRLNEGKVKEVLFETGLCSKAEVIKNDWYVGEA